jgi:hypothetical protein
LRCCCCLPWKGLTKEAVASQNSGSRGRWWWFFTVHRLGKKFQIRVKVCTKMKLNLGGGEEEGITAHQFILLSKQEWRGSLNKRGAEGAAWYSRASSGNSTCELQRRQQHHSLQQQPSNARSKQQVSHGKQARQSSSTWCGASQCVVHGHTKQAASSRHGGRAHTAALARWRARAFRQ